MTNYEGEERQKQELEEMYRILFEHPLVEAITGWDFTTDENGFVKVKQKQESGKDSCFLSTERL